MRRRRRFIFCPSNAAPCHNTRPMVLQLLVALVVWTPTASTPAATATVATAAAAAVAAAASCCLLLPSVDDSRRRVDGRG